ncbi:MAG: primosomal protein N', partial [Acidobacteriota bacterium]|nr:primosomal protein N' [Acidobacteriota bacterium]
MPQKLGTSPQPTAISPASRETEVRVPLYAKVAVPLHVSQTFTYRLPETARELAHVGSRVLVPLGRSAVTAFIVELLPDLSSHQTLTDTDIRSVEKVLDPTPLITPEVLEITRWVSEYYGSPWGEILKAALPPGINPKSEQLFALTPQGIARIDELESEDTAEARVLRALANAGELDLEALIKLVRKREAPRTTKELQTQGLIATQLRSATAAARARTQRIVRLRRVPLADQVGSRKVTAAQQRVLDALMNQEIIPLPELLRVAGVSISAVNTLIKHGCLEMAEEKVRRDPLARATLPRVDEYTLTGAQDEVLSQIEPQLRSGAYAAFLLHGVTGSGKTEVYMRAMRTCLELGRAAMMLVPEIALTPVFSRRLRSNFGDQVAIFHSSLSKGERFDEWMRVKTGDARIVIGTRSGVFAPIANLGLVIVDEEHESTYRQQDSPRYNGRDTAIVRAQKEDAVVILGSATPSLESFHNSQTGKYQYLQLPSRIGDRPLASARIVDMREVFARHKKPQVFSEELLEAIEATQKRGEQSIILLNRRGYSSFVLCRSCGETIQCPNCDVTLTYHRSERVIVCHYCNHRAPAPEECPACSGKYIYYVGEGTEQIEAMLSKLFPTLRIARIDRDTASRRGAFEKSIFDFSAGKIDMLVGTQMLAKGHDFPNVTLVGVVSVDAGLALPDFRAAERTFQLITQVAGRAGRGERPGRVLIQTYHPNHYALRHASAQDYSGFYREENRHRENHGYPPFVSLASLLLHGAALGKVRVDALELRKELDLANQERSCRILGPAPAPLARLKGEHRIQLLVKSRSRRQLRKVIDTALDAVVG